MRQQNNYVHNEWSLTTCQLLGRAIVPASRLEVAPEKVFLPLRALVSAFLCEVNIWMKPRLDEKRFLDENWICDNLSIFCVLMFWTVVPESRVTGPRYVENYICPLQSNSLPAPEIGLSVSITCSEALLIVDGYVVWTFRGLFIKEFHLRATYDSFSLLEL